MALREFRGAIFLRACFARDGARPQEGIDYWKDYSRTTETLAEGTSIRMSLWVASR
jgi:hypothetical protein